MPIDSNYVAVTVAPAALPSHDAHAVIVQATRANTDTIRVGGSTRPSIELTAGQSCTLSGLDNMNEIWAVAESGTQHVNYCWMRFRRR